MIKRKSILHSDDGLAVSEEEYFEKYYEYVRTMGYHYEWNTGYLEEIPASDSASFSMYTWFNYKLLREYHSTWPIANIVGLKTGFRLAISDKVTIRLVLKEPYSFFASLGFGAVGYATAASVGAKLALRDRPVVALVGDGSFLMNGFETAAAVNYDVPVVWIVFNNAMYGIIHHGRKMFEKPVPEGMVSTFKRVDFTKVAEGLGARAIKIKDPGQITPDLVRDILDQGRPTVLDVWIDDTIAPPIRSRIKSIDKRKKADSASQGS